MARKKKLTDKQWIEKLSQESGVNANLSETLWLAFLDIIDKEVNSNPDGICYIPNFGTFSKNIHKGHPLNLDTNNTEKVLPDYEVLKFKVDKAYKKRVLRLQ